MAARLKSDIHRGPFGLLSRLLQCNYLSGYARNDVEEPANIVANITLLDFTGDTALTPVKMDVLKDGEVVRTLTGHPDGDRNMTITNVAAGTYDVAFEACKCLRKAFTGVQVLGPDPTNLTVELVNGDINGDNSIGFSDFNILRKGWGMEGD